MVNNQTMLGPRGGRTELKLQHYDLTLSCPNSALFLYFSFRIGIYFSDIPFLPLIVFTLPI